MATHQDILIIGAGTGGIMVASKMIKEDRNLKISIIDPADMHYYQAAWTLVGANTYKFKDTGRSMDAMIPPGVNWIKEAAESFHPEKNAVVTKNGNEFTYDYLVVCPGLTIDPTMVDGLADCLGKGVVCSNYTDPDHTWEVLKNFKGGTALFTQPTTPIKCGGAPQKIMYLAADHFRKTGIANKTKTVYATPGTVIFGVKPIAKTLMEVIERYDISVNFGYQLVAVDGNKKIAWYKMADHEKYHNQKELGIIEDGDLKGIPFDMMHLAPPQRAPKFISNSPLATDLGWLSVDSGTLQHTKYKNIFGVGDACQLPTAKTGAAIRKQVPIVVGNIQELMRNKTLTDKKYNGYSSCPLVTAYGKMVLAEFDYDQNFTPDPKLKQMLVFNSDKESWRLWMLKKYVLPYLYWNKMMKGIDV